MKTAFEKFIEKSIKKHGSKYDYSKAEYKNCIEPVEIICIKHGSFMQSPRVHSSGSRCKVCAKESYSEKRSFKTDICIKKLKDKFGNFYDYSLIKYKNKKDKVIINCPKHGLSKFTAGELTRKKRKYCCNDCFKETHKKQVSLKEEDFFKKIKEKRGDKYDYSKSIYINSTTKIKIICKIHGEFESNPRNHLYGNDCPECAKIKTKSQNEWINSFKNKNIEKNKTLKINKKIYKPDGIDFGTKTIYEFYGDYWHGNIKIFNPKDINQNNKKTFETLFKNTIKREKELKKHGYKIISIWESEWNKKKQV
jgi:hypothetical protein